MLLREAGDILDVTDEKTARSVAEKRLEKKRSSELHVNAKVTLGVTSSTRFSREN